MAAKPFPWEPVFLTALREWPVVQHACDAAQVDRAAVYRRRQTDEAFAKAWEDAMEAGVDRAEREAFRRAVAGVSEDVYHQGVVVGQKLVFSDALLGKVLSARRKAYRTSSTEVTSPDGSMSPAADENTRAARVAQLLALAERRKKAEDERDPEDFG